MYNNQQLETFKEELNRLKKSAPQDGEVKYIEHIKKKKVGFIIKKEITEVEREIIEVGNYITLSEFTKVLHYFFEDVNFKIDRISRHICDKLNIDRVKIFLEKNIFKVQLIDNDLFNEPKNIEINLEGGYLSF